MPKKRSYLGRSAINSKPKRLLKTTKELENNKKVLKGLQLNEIRKQILFQELNNII